MRKQTGTLLILGGVIFVVLVLLFLGISATFVQNDSINSAFEGTSASIQSTNAFVNNAVAATSRAKTLAGDFSDVNYAAPNSQPTTVSADVVPQKRIVIQNASLELIVDDTTATLTAITDLTNKLGGWVVTSNSHQSANRAGKQLTYGSINIRVPADKLDSTLQQIKAGAVSVNSEQITGSDVTSQYVDLTSHLTNLQAAEEQLRKIMDAATKTDDVLSVYKQLVDVRGQIEQIKGQLNFYDQSAAFSSIDITLTPSDDNQPIIIAGWQPGNTVKTAISTLIQLVQGMIDLAIWLVIVVLPFAVPLLIVYAIYRRRRSRPGTRPPLESTPTPPDVV